MGLALPCLDKYGRKGQDISMLTQTQLRYNFIDDIPFKYFCTIPANKLQGICVRINIEQCRSFQPRR